MFEAVVEWVRKDLESREELMADLTVKVRLPLMTPQFLADRVAQEELVKTSLRCRYMIVLNFFCVAVLQELNYQP